MFLIPLSNSELSVEVSEEDYLTLCLLGPWHLAGKGYPRSNKNPCEYLHRIVGNRIGLSTQEEIDHIDRNKLNAKRDNLRSSTRSLQMVNAGTQSNNTSGHKGISYEARPGRKPRFVIQIQREGKRILVGRCATLEEAIRKRNHYIKLHNITLVE